MIRVDPEDVQLGSRVGLDGEGYRAPGIVRVMRPACARRSSPRSWRRTGSPCSTRSAARTDIDLSVVYLARSDPSRRWVSHEWEMRFRHRAASGALAPVQARRVVRPSHLGSAGDASAVRNPDVVVGGGWDQIAYHEASLCTAVLGARFLWWVESNLRDRRPDGLGCVGRSSGGSSRASTGSSCRERARCDYVEELGARSRTSLGRPNAVDNDCVRARSGGPLFEVRNRPLLVRGPARSRRRGSPLSRRLGHAPGRRGAADRGKRVARRGRPRAGRR